MYDFNSTNPEITIYNSSPGDIQNVMLPMVTTWVILAIFIIYTMISTSHDRNDLRANDVIWLSPDDPIHPSHCVFIVSFEVKDCTELYTNLDFYIRLRGTIGDSPLIHYRDYDEHFCSGESFNFGVHCPLSIGPVHSLDVIFDHPMALDEEYLLTLKNVEIRDAWWIPWADIGKPEEGSSELLTMTARSTSHRINFRYQEL